MVMSRALELFMEKASIRERVRNILRDLAERPLEEILSYAIAGEVESTDFYQFLSLNLPDGYPKETFKKFIEVEMGHDRKVMKIYRSLFPDQTPKPPQYQSWVQELLKRDFRLKNIGDYLKALQAGMDAEQLAEHVYLMLADMLDDVEFQRIMYDLAKDEREHYEFLKKEYQFYSKVQAKRSLEELIKELAGGKK